MSWAALILAGSRSGAADPVATYAGVSHKALIVLEGQTLLSRVAGALQAAGASRLAISCDDPAVQAAATALGADPLPAAAGPSLSVAAGAAHLGTPLLVTTADHALLAPEWVTDFLSAIPPEADVAALTARREVVQAAAPGTARTYLKFADGQWSGCNLFWLANHQSLAVVDLWRRVETLRKRPWAMARLLGPSVMARYVAGRLTLGTAAARLGQMAGVTTALVASPHGLAAVDVDKPADLDLVRKLVGQDAPAPGKNLNP